VSSSQPHLQGEMTTDIIETKIPRDLRDRIADSRGLEEAEGRCTRPVVRRKARSSDQPLSTLSEGIQTLSDMRLQAASRNTTSSDVHEVLIGTKNDNDVSWMRTSKRLLCAYLSSAATYCGAQPSTILGAIIAPHLKNRSNYQAWAAGAGLRSAELQLGDPAPVNPSGRHHQ
jgi:hypothetical protein